MAAVDFSLDGSVRAPSPHVGFIDSVVRRCRGWVSGSATSDCSVTALDIPQINTLQSRFFDLNYYLKVYPDVAEARVDALQHYLRHGWREGRNPNAWFSTAAYLKQHPDVLSTGEDPLTHLARMALAPAAAQPVPAESPFAELSTPSVSPLLSRLMAHQPAFSTKWAKETYLAKELSEIDRARTHLHTYVFLNDLYPNKRLQGMLFNGVKIWSSSNNLEEMEIRLSVSEPVLNEGELSLTLNLNGSIIYVFSFSIFPARITLDAVCHKLLISRMQVAPRRRDVMKCATKMMADVSPQAALFAAAQGFAQAVGVSDFIGVPAERQVSLHPEAVARCQGVYDAFYRTCGAELADDGFYHGQMMKKDRPLSTIKAGHKIRTRQKRALRHEIRLSAATVLTSLQSRDSKPVGAAD